MPGTHRASAYTAWVAVCILWGTTYLAIRIGLETIPPALLGGIRFTIAGAVLAAALLLWREPAPPISRWPGLALVGFLTICVGNGGVVVAEQWVPSGVAAVCVATIPFWMIGLEILAGEGERRSSGLWGGLLVGFAGIVLLVWSDITAGGSAGQRFLLGMFALQAGCFGWALGSVLSRRHVRHDSAIFGAALQMAFGGLAMLLAGTLRGEWTELAFNDRTLAAEIYLTLVGSIVGYTAYTYALKYLPISTVSLYAYVNPVVAVVLGALLVSERLSLRVVIASVMVLAGSALVQWRGRAAVCIAYLLLLPSTTYAQQPAQTKAGSVSVVDVLQVLGGAALGFGMHESGHLLLDVTFDASPGVRKVSAGVIPFFAITHEPVSPAREFAISSAGFWVQHATSEILLSRRPDLRHEDAAVAKGLIAFNVLTSVIYSGAAFARDGPLERDTRGMALAAEVSEPWVGAAILAPAMLDAARYYRPASPWLRWTSRAAKVAAAVLILKAKR